ncbi:MAG: phosphoenolpyruvate--protein phosphotransferase [Planctomycetaceae bacterium]|jgi:phosphoenolpyruvate-protein phosphotransferase (PTS system enzyme I)|nr:phosphoenolpyruvate--protein phosphotransferase [Planctomycetaceae bacterium]MDC0307913.1 phosphoenolpyruvate--protein phosphotransferase [Planctomycetaceae bacterium]MDG2390200.1 phosphoenolpyruvate--protein phosphotransferase [Planctomycetaceae bacterium]
MMIKQGIPVSPGVAIGPAFIMGNEDYRIPQRFVRIDDVEKELQRLDAAIEQVCVELGEHEELASDRLGKQYGAIFAAHQQLIQDPKMISEIRALIQDKCFSPEYATSKVLEQYAKLFQSLGNQYFAERSADIVDLQHRMLKHLLGERREGLSNLTEPVLILANNLTPSETANLDKKHVLGFVTEAGGRTSHTAILAGALQIPAIVGVGEFLSDVSGGEMIIIDGYHGELIIDPDESVLERFTASRQRHFEEQERLKTYADLVPETRDGERITLMGNIEFPQEVEHCVERGADGVGLYRTEFLYLQEGKEPTEEVHYEAYCKVVESMQGRPVVIRTLDLGADKIPGALEKVLLQNSNPMLGLRSIRLSLQNQPLFKTQLRAILRAAMLGDIRIMFPLVSTLREIRQARMLLSDVMEDLEDEGIEFRRDVPVGMMVEVPSAAILAEEFAREVDFFSIGTNDLIQYTLAVDRADPSVANLYSAGDPAVIRLIQQVVQAAHRENKPVTVCGQMSSEPRFLPLLIGLGIRQVSVTPAMIPELKEVIRNLEVKHANEIASHVSGLDSARDVENYLRGELHKICPAYAIDF